MSNLFLIKNAIFLKFKNSQKVSNIKGFAYIKNYIKTIDFVFIISKKLEVKQ